MTFKIELFSFRFKNDNSSFNKVIEYKKIVMIIIGFWN